MREQNVRCRMFGKIGVNRRAVHGVSARRISAIGPIQEPILPIELEIDWFGQTIEQKLDIGAVGRILAFRNLDACAKDSPLPRIVWTSLGPINVSGLNIDDHAIWHSASVENDFAIRPVGVYRMNPAAASFEKK